MNLVTTMLINVINNSHNSVVDCDIAKYLIEKLGIIGLGNTGQATARIAAAFGMQVCAYTSKPQSQLPGGIRKMALGQIPVLHGRDSQNLWQSTVPGGLQNFRLWMGGKWGIMEQTTGARRR